MCGRGRRQSGQQLRLAVGADHGVVGEPVGDQPRHVADPDPQCPPATVVDVVSVVGAGGADQDARAGRGDLVAGLAGGPRQVRCLELRVGGGGKHSGDVDRVQPRAGVDLDGAAVVEVHHAQARGHGDGAARSLVGRGDLGCLRAADLDVDGDGLGAGHVGDSPPTLWTSAFSAARTRSLPSDPGRGAGKALVPAVFAGTNHSAAEGR